MTWTTHSYTTGEVLGSTKVTNLFSNFAALAGGHSGAPTFISSAFSPGALHQSHLASATASGTGSGTSYTLTGGTYSWWTAGGNGEPFNAGDTSAGVIGVSGISIDERYIQSSPPYNLGDGDIPLFMLATVAPSGAIVTLSVAPDPPWANNGPTNIAPERIDPVTRRGYRYYAMVGDTLLVDVLRTPRGRQQMLRGELDVRSVELEITQEIKNRDISVVPHNWPGLNPAASVVMLNPFSPASSRMWRLYEQLGAGELRRELFAFAQCSPSERQFSTPPGVVAADWSLRRG
jgi:hypothetical protein